MTTIATSVGTPGTATSIGVAMPEFLSRRDAENGPWIVGEGTPTRGDAWTSLTERMMRVPFGDASLARVIRAHEMMHAKVSPVDFAGAVRVLRIAADVPQDLVMACEEVRVNALVQHAGFDIDLLTDGSEKNTGVALAKMGPAGWNGIVQMVTATANTKACNSLIAGIRSVNPDMANAAKVVRKAVRKHLTDERRTATRLRQPVNEYIGSTQPESAWIDHGDDAPQEEVRINKGFQSTIRLARIVNAFRLHEPSSQEGGDGQPGSADEEIDDSFEEMANRADRGERGQWAKLIVDQIPLTKHVDGRIGRKRIASDTGTNPRRMHRLLTDPERRVFDRRTRGKGGVVLIDQSGSMHLDDSDIKRMIEAAPGCVIIGYSHRPGSIGLPNAWVLANRGKVVEGVRSGNGGNGVDGPALRFALTHRRTGEPFVWVCDGHVTDGANDQDYPSLQDECASIVSKHGIHMVATADEAVEALHRANRGERLPTWHIGGVEAGMRRNQRR